MIRIQKIFIVFVLGLAIVSCGSRKKVVTKKAETKTVKEPVAVDEEVKK